jgi:hypothetical protein
LDALSGQNHPPIPSGDEHMEKTTMKDITQEQRNRLINEPKQYQSGNSQLLIDYRNALIAAYKLGEDIKKLYNIIPPKVLFDTDFVNTTHRDPKGYPVVQLTLQVS